MESRLGRFGRVQPSTTLNLLTDKKHASQTAVGSRSFSAALLPFPPPGPSKIEASVGSVLLFTTIPQANGSYKDAEVDSRHP
jgi:hypothetical protein